MLSFTQNAHPHAPHVFRWSFLIVLDVVSFGDFPVDKNLLLLFAGFRTLTGSPWITGGCTHYSGAAQPRQLEGELEDRGFDEM